MPLPLPDPLHAWDVSPTQAVQLQRRWVEEVREVPLPPDWRTVAGVDVSVREDRVRAALVVLERGTLAPVDHAVWEGPVAFPYVPGLLSFREVPAILPALEQLRAMPDVFVLDGQGRAHPRRFGLACHLGVWLDRPALGAAKSILVGKPQGTLAEAKGAHVPLVHRGEVVGEAVRTRDRVNPMYVSVGHRCTLADAVGLVLETATRYKLPQPTHLAHRLSKHGKL